MQLKILNIVDIDHYILSKESQLPISHNVPAVYDGLAVAIKETVGFRQPQDVAEKNRTKAVDRLRFFGSRSALAA
jgi:hypothetical protein